MSAPATSSTSSRPGPGGAAVLHATRWATHAGALAVGALVLISVGQPLFAEDTWLHLALGAAHAEQGPWLAADPLLHTAESPPAPAAWLFDLGLYGVERIFGFQGLRLAHVLLAASILGLGWSLLRRTSGSARWASLATCVFATLAAYRLFQLRPHLASMLALLVVLRLLIVPAGPPPWSRVAAATAVFALWANVHGAFLLGLAVLGAALAGVALDWLLGSGDRVRKRAHALRLAAAFALASLATLANPSGLAQHLLYFTAGSATPELGVVADEWARIDLLAWPQERLPPSPFAWVATWLLLLATPVALARGMRQVRQGRGAVGPGLLAAAALAAIAMLSAVRLLWLGVVPLLVIGAALAPALRCRGARVATAVAAVLAVPAFVSWGPWPMISAGVHPAHYRLPYAVSKVDAHAVWLLRDAGLEGNLWNDYATGNFLGYWLAPRMRAFVNGSLNLPHEAMAALHAVRWQAGPQETTRLLDRYEVDVFFGTGLPELPLPERPDISTTSLLEGAPGWIPIFRSVRSALYLRDDDRNRENLARVAAYYERERVPFDPERGFEVERVIRAAPRWALRHGLLPPTFRLLEGAAASLVSSERSAAAEQLAQLYALLGLYDRAAALDEWRLARDPEALSAQRRLAWSLLRGGRAGDALEAAERLDALAPDADPLARMLVGRVRQRARLEGDEAAALVSRTPLLPPGGARQVVAGLVPAPPRSSIGARVREPSAGTR